MLISLIDSDMDLIDYKDINLGINYLLVMVI
jgi:hypothetical protein